MEKINNGESHFTQVQIVEEKQRMMLQSFYIPHCCLVIGEAYPDHKVFMSIKDEEDLIHILNDNVIIHHCHYSGTVYGPAHQICNSKVQLAIKHLKINIYAHNATFDHSFVLKGINLSMLAQKGEIIPTLNLLGDNSERIKIIRLRDCIFMDSYKLFSSLAELCDIKSPDEITAAEGMLVAFLTAGTYFYKVYNQMTNDEKTRLLQLLNGKGYYCYDYVTDGEVLKETSLPPLKYFNNVLKQEGPDLEQYAEALEIWDLLKCRTIDDYTCIYNVMDSINLAVIMEQRMEMLKEYLFLDARHFTSMSVYGQHVQNLRQDRLSNVCRTRG